MPSMDTEREWRRAYQRNYQRQNREKINAYQLGRYHRLTDEQREQLHAYQRNYHIENREKHNAYQRKWQRNHPPTEEQKKRRRITRAKYRQRDNERKRLRRETLTSEERAKIRAQKRVWYWQNREREVARQFVKRLARSDRVTFRNDRMSKYVRKGKLLFRTPASPIINTMQRKYTNKLRPWDQMHERLYDNANAITPAERARRWTKAYRQKQRAALSVLNETPLGAALRESLPGRRNLGRRWAIALATLKQDKELVT